MIRKIALLLILAALGLTACGSQGETISATSSPTLAPTATLKPDIKSDIFYIPHTDVPVSINGVVAEGVDAGVVFNLYARGDGQYDSVMAIEVLQKDGQPYSIPLSEVCITLEQPGYMEYTLQTNTGPISLQLSIPPGNYCQQLGSNI